MGSEENVNNIKKEYELVPPDGGWAYMIWISLIIFFSVSTMFIPCFGMIFNEFYIRLGMSSTDIQVLYGVSSLSSAIGGFVAGPMMKVMSMRKLSFVSAIFMSSGVFGLAFANSFAMLILCHGIFVGAGVGIAGNVHCTALNDYFLEKRFIIASLAQTIAGAAAIAAPLVLHWTNEHYGFRGTLLFMAGAYMQTLVGSSLLQPVKWHLKRVPVSPETVELMEKRNGSNVKNTESSQAVDINIDHILQATDSKSIIGYIKTMLDWPFLARFLRSCVCVGAPLSMVSDVMFTLFTPQALYARHWTENEVAWMLSLLSFGDIATRIFLIVASAWLKNVGSDIIFIFGMVLDIIAKLVFLWFPHPTVTAVTLTLTGCSRCLFYVLFALVISEAVPPEKYAIAIGVSFLLCGVVSMTLGPAIGAVRDATGDYTLMFYLLIAVMAAVTLAWSIEIYRNRTKRWSTSKMMSQK